MVYGVWVGGGATVGYGVGGIVMIVMMMVMIVVVVSQTRGRRLS